MHSRRLSYRMPAAALFLGFLLLATGLLVAREGQGESPSAPATEGQDSQGTGQPAEVTGGDFRTSEPEKPPRKRAASKRGGVPLLPGSTLPPRNLKRVGDHWTPYDPPDPESFPPEATLHIIVPGDTLWDLADLVFGNPYLWPQIWNENRYILDSHWIYPGDPLLLPARPTVVSEIVPQGQEGAPAPGAAAPAETTPEEAPAEGPAEAPAAEQPSPAPQQAHPETAYAPRSLPKIEPLADEFDLRCSGYIAPREERPDYFIANQEEEGKLGLTEGDMIYLNRGRSNGHMEPGVEYSIVEREGEVRHPMSHRFLGYYYRRLGTVRVLAAQETTAIATISMACDEIRTGQALVPLRVASVPARPVPAFNRLATVPPDRPTGYVVHVKDNQERAGAGQVVDIDMGYDDGLKPGDFLTVFMPAEPFNKFPKVKYNYEWRNRRFQSPKIWRDDSDNLPPPKIIGQMVVIFAEKRTATAKILQSVREIEIGDSVVVY